MALQDLYRSGLVLQALGSILSCLCDVSPYEGTSRCPFPGLYHPPCTSPVTLLQDKQQLPNSSGLAVSSVFSYMGCFPKEGQNSLYWNMMSVQSTVITVSYILDSMDTPVYLAVHTPVQNSCLVFCSARAEPGTRYQIIPALTFPTKSTSGIQAMVLVCLCYML